MRVSLKFLIVGVLVTFGLASPAYAANKSIVDATAKPDKVAQKVWFGPAPGQLKKLHDIGLPKRIGLISFYIYDTGSHEFSAMAATYGGTYFKAVGLAEHAANRHASEFAKLDVPAIKERFAEKGLEVLLPVEFLDSQVKIDTYFDFDLPKTGLQKATEATLAWVDKNPHITGAADGYRMIPLHASFLGQGVMGELEEFRKALELDALMVVTTHTGAVRSAVALLP
jgi:hypothetical protein